MTNTRKHALDLLVSTFGLESPLTILAFEVDEHYPEKEYDGIFYEFCSRLWAVFKTPMDEEEEQLAFNDLEEYHDEVKEALDLLYEASGWND